MLRQTRLRQSGSGDGTKTGDNRLKKPTAHAFPHFLCHSRRAHSRKDRGLGQTFAGFGQKFPMFGDHRTGVIWLLGSMSVEASAGPNAMIAAPRPAANTVPISTAILAIAASSLLVNA